MGNHMGTLRCYSSRWLRRLQSNDMDTPTTIPEQIMSMAIIGIDPGAGGGICVRKWTGEYEVIKMPETQGDILDFLRRFQPSQVTPTRAYMELLPAYMGTNIPQSSVAVMFENFGFIKGVLQSMGVPLRLIPPNIWTKSLGIGTREMARSPKGATAAQKKEVQRENQVRKNEWKRKLRSEAQRRYPDIPMTLNKCDAVLIMDYGIRQFQAGL